MEYITEYLNKMSPDNMCALFLVSIDNLEDVRESCGEEAAEQAVQFVSQALSSLFRATDRITQTREDEFIIFIYGPISEKTVSEKARVICENLQFAVSTAPLVNIVVNVGVFMTSENGCTYEELCEEARDALLMARSSGDGSGYYVKTPKEEREEEQELSSGGLINMVALPMLLQHMEGGVCLLEAGEQVRLTYASSGFYKMLGLKPGAVTLPCPLSDLRINPEDEKEYELLIRTNPQSGNTVSHIQRVMRGDGKWIWRRVRTVRMPSGPGETSMMLEVSSDISELIEKDQLLQENIARLKSVFEQTPHVLWEVDVQKHVFSIFDVTTQSCVLDKRVENFPETFLKNGHVHPDSMELFQKFADGIMNGNEAGYGNFILKNNGDGQYDWVSFSYHMTYGQDGTPIKAVGVQERLPAAFGLINTPFPRRPLPETVRHHLICRMRVDLTQNRVEEMWEEGMDKTPWVKDIDYLDLIDQEKGRLFIKGEEQIFTERFAKETLMELFERGERWSSRVYRCVDTAGRIRWMEDTVNFQRDPYTGHIYMYVCFVDTQQRHEWESMLPSNIEREKVGGLYTPETFGALTKHLISRGGGGNLCVMAMISVGIADDVKWIDESVTREKILKFIGVAFSLALGVHCIVGRHSEDKILVFFPQGKSKYEIRRKLEESFSYVKSSLADILDPGGLHFCAGVAVEPARAADYDILALRASNLCSAWTKNAVDTVNFADEDSGWMWNGQEKEVEQLFGSGQKPYVLSNDGKKAAFECVAAMLTADSLEDSMKGVLRCIGMYYQAERAYIAMLSENGEEVAMLYEWTRTGKSSIRQVMLGKPVEKIYVFRNCLNRQEPVFVKNPTADVYGQVSRWYFMAFPLVEQQHHHTVGILCVENAGFHWKHDALIRLTAPYILREFERFRKNRDSSTAHPAYRADRLPNMRDYMRVIYTLNSDQFSSLGAITVNVPNFSSLNGSRGFQYGAEMLEEITEELESIFGKNYIYRIWDAEFVVLFPNTIYESFLARCTRLRTRIQRRYPGQIQVGYTWSDGVFRAKNLVQEAQAIMKCDNVLHSPEKDSMDPVYDIATAMESETHITKYVPYFQPKIDMRNGKLVGAEALVRGVGDDGNIITPDRFIEALEKNGGIRELDFYMLENVMRQMSQWKSQGYPEIPISVNMSRRTLFSPTVLASILAIESRYPEISPDLIELEITESAGDVETVTLSGIVEHFRQFGIGFELDDFGSRYANIAIFSNIKFNAIKLDRSLVNNLPVSDISKMMVENIANICRSFGMECIAEGVETRQHEEILLRAGCSFGQGYYYSKPIPPSIFEQKYFIGNTGTIR